MPLGPGARLGPYEIVAAIGAGGMGEVYRATDTNLGRQVAIKILPDAFAQDPERVARFEREAKTLASLNHPHIAIIHGLEKSQGTYALVIELIEGEDLSQRIARGPIPIDEALPLAKQIAEALEAAHEQGVIHRDLKPANIKVREDGTVKVLDFGLAKLLGPAEAGPSVPKDVAAGFSRPDASVSPTITSPAMMTGVGVLLGTAAYMSPEQAKGRAADKRSDIWAYGCVLYEMLTGRRAFDGDHISETLANVLKAEPDWHALPAQTPEPVRRLLRRCLTKDPKARAADASIARIEIDDLQKDTQVDGAMLNHVRRYGRERLGWIVAGCLLLVAIASLVFAFAQFRQPAPDIQPIRFTISAPENATMSGVPAVISPDGRRLAFVATTAGRSQIWIRSIDVTSARPLPGTENADYPFWSPDSRSIAFFAAGKLRKVDASGGPALTLCDAPAARGGAWSRDGVIVFAPTVPSALYRVSSSGGTAAPLTELDLANGEISHRDPMFLPDARHFLFFVQGTEGKQGIYLGSLDSKDRPLLLAGTSSGAYAPPGYLLFVREGTLMAQRFDTENFRLTGEASPVADTVGFYNASTGTFSVSENGVLAHSLGNTADQRQLAWFDRSGKLIERIGSAAPIFDVALSTDRKRAAVQWGNNDMWVVDLVRGGIASRLTFDPTVEDWPVWSPDGQVLFNSTMGGAGDLYSKASSGAGEEVLVLKSAAPKRPTDWSHDGRFIVYDSDDPKTRADIWVLPLFGEKKPEPILRTPFSEQHGRLSPDGKWIAYISDESGRPEVYVQSFPPSGGKWQVSTNGGFTPRWRGDGRELYYLTLERTIMAVDVNPTEPAFEVQQAKPLFVAPVDVVSAAAGNRFDVTADGQRFLINAPVENTTSASLGIVVVINWTAGLNK
jgi:eukaryotic-like serine/threonine-protein kinase